MEKAYKINTRKLPLLALRGMWIMPGARISFDVGRPFSKSSLESALASDSLLFITSQKNPIIEEAVIENFNQFGVVARVKQSIRLPDDTYRVIVEGLYRAKALSYENVNNHYQVEVEEYRPKKQEFSSEAEALMRLSKESLKELSKFRKDIPQEAVYNLDLIEDNSEFADTLISYINPSLEEVQELLEELDVNKRLEKIIQIIDQEVEISKFKNDLANQVQVRLNKSQKEFYLREQLQVIKEELDESEGGGKSFEEKYKEDIEALPIKQEHKDYLLKELSRLEYINMASPEANVIRTYLDNVFEIPFGKYSDDQIDINKSREILDKDHHGLEDVKERILEYLAVRKLKGDMKGSILCLVGPPGVGKTSIVKSVAESMNREYISMRLGGVTDESEIRGHRKTYVGAMPGRIISSLQRADTLNPVFLMDEIDKISSDFRADPSSALLEVLDPNQNDEFVDRYIEIPVDLSKIMFVTTANTTSTIPSPLLDRMEVIEVGGYTEYDKLEIARKYLLPKQLENHGLKASQVKVSDSALKLIIKNYTRESGVRNLEREIGKIARKAAVKIIEGQEKISVSLKNYRDFLGREKILDDDIVKSPQVGVVTGLAWTQVGGELLQIEVSTMKGKGEIQLTGSLGDVMKESAMAALTYIRSNMEDFNLEDKDLENMDVHVHVPEGATPKDGPSAGVTMTVGLASVLTGKKVRQDIAMTGEVTIRGRVLAIGGLKEKALAALRYGIKNIIIPKQNERDIEDIPEDARKELTFYPVIHVSEVLGLALIEGED